MTTLSIFIKAVGNEEAARLFDTKPRTVMSWRYGVRLPGWQAAGRIMRATAGHPLGPVTFDDIYGPTTKKPAKRTDRAGNMRKDNE